MFALRWLVPLCIYLGIVPANIAEAQSSRWTHYGIRPMAMGNAYVAVADDFNSLFYNPAGLTRIKKWDGEFFNFIGGQMSTNSATAITDLLNLSGGQSSGIGATFDIIEKYTGTNQGVGLRGTPYLVTENFGMGIGGDIGFWGGFHRYPSVSIDAGTDIIVIPTSMAMSFLQKRLSVGFGIKARFFTGVRSDFSITELQALSGDNGSNINDYASLGMGGGADFGILFTPIDLWEPTLGISITDIGGTSYNQIDKSVKSPDITLASANLGLSMKPYQKKESYLRTSIDIHSINQPFSFTKKLNLGVEYGYSEILKLQAGLHQGYLTGGFQVDVGLLNLRFASYSEEMGAKAGTSEDRRYVVSIKLLI